VAPASAQEALLCRLYGELTGAARVSAADNFFALGGHSLLAMRLIGAIRRETGCEVALRQAFEHPTPRGLGAVLARAGAHIQYDPLLPIRPVGSQPPLFCVHPGGGLALIYKNLADTLDPDIPVYGLQAKGLEQQEEPHGSVVEMAACYLTAVRTAEPAGPYRLLGWSFGGVVAHEMARLIEAAGEEVEVLLLLDVSLSVPAGAEAPAGEADLVQEAAGLLEIDISALDRETARAELTRAAIARGLVPAGTGAEWIEQIMGEMRREGELMRAHQPGIVRASTVYYRAADNEDEWVIDNTRKLCGEPFVIIPIAAKHNSMLKPDPAATIGGDLGRRLIRREQ
jgi:thioesterase domain-containing protein/acyl carrier protein